MGPAKNKIKYNKIFIFIFAKASNPLVEVYDTSKAKNYITYLDANNLRLH